MTLWSRLHGVGIGDGGKRVVCVSLLWKEELSRWIYIIQPVTEQHFQQRQTTGVARECLFLSFHVESSPSWLLWNLLGEAEIMWLSFSGPSKQPSFDWVLCFVMVFSERSTTVYQLRRGLVPNYAERGAPLGSYAEAILWPTTWGTEGTLEIFSSFSYLPTVSTWGTEGTLEILVVSLTCVQWQPVYCSFLIENAYSSYM